MESTDNRRSLDVIAQAPRPSARGRDPLAGGADRNRCPARKLELLDRNAALARAFTPLSETEMKSLRTSVAETERKVLAGFFRRHRDA
jgi:hypothetical protein